MNVALIINLTNIQQHRAGFCSQNYISDTTTLKRQGLLAPTES